LENKVNQYSGNLKLIAIMGASNLTGYIPDIPKIAALAHRHGAILFVDAAQLAPHRPISMLTQGIDALAFSAHKLYAPFGLGVLALPKSLLENLPVDPGGGSIDMISENNIVWAVPEMRHQTGTWNVTGIIAAGASCQVIMDYGWENILAEEKKLVRYAAEKLSNVPGLTLYVPKEKYFVEDRIGTFAFNLYGFHRALVSAILDNEFGIETRAGTICNHKLVKRWMNIDNNIQRFVEQKIAQGDKLASYGIVRVSLGIHNTREDIDFLADALTRIVTYGPALSYRPIAEQETFIPV